MLLEVSLKTDFIVTVEENVLNGGFGSAVIENLEKMEITGKKIKRIGLPDKFIEHGSQDILMEKYGLNPENIENTILALLPKRQEIFTLNKKVL
jgi:1-deoxy-D-xylulose-5-phosphate synthase